MASLYLVKHINKLISAYKTPVLYSGSSMLKGLVSMMTGIIIAKYISPNDLGLWAIISLASTYSIFLQGGLINGLNLELPYAYGRSEDDYAKKMAGVVQTFLVSISILILMTGFVCFLALSYNDPKIKHGILAISLIIALSFYQNYLLSTFRSKHSFLKLSTIQIVDICTSIFSLLLVVYFAYSGMIVRSIVILFVSVLQLHIFRPIKVGFLWDKMIFLKLLKTGIPIFALAYLEATALTSDKVWLTKFSTISNVGLYTFSLYALNLFMTFATSVANYIYPRMTFEYGKTGSKMQLWKQVKKITFVLASLQLPFVIVGFFIIPIAINRFFPNYSLSAEVMQLLIIAGYFKGCVVGVNAVWSMKSWKHMILYQTSYAGMLVMFSFVGVYFFDNKIIGAASGILLANLLNLFWGMYITYLATHSNK